jgi:tRNA(Ile)-lysidine synthase
MHPRSGLVIRPLIEASRTQVRDFLRVRGVKHIEDASNADLDIPRNRIRHELIPLLEARFAPRIVEVLHREAAIARDDAEFLDAIASAAARRLTLRQPGRVEIDARPLLEESPAIIRRVLRDAQQFVSGGKFVGFEAVQAVLALAVSKSSGPIDLPGHRVQRIGETIVLTRRAGRSLTRQPECSFSYALDVPGSVNVPEAACAISAEAQIVPAGEGAATRWRLAARADEAVVDADHLPAPLMVRSRRPGDVFRPLGFHGRKKLQDLFVDAKVQRDKRATIPVVVDAAGRIIWVAGLSMAEDFRVSDRTKAVVILKRRPA